MESGSVVVTKGVSFRYDLTLEWIKLKSLGKGSFGVVDLVKIVDPIYCILAVKHSPSASLSLLKEYRILHRFLGCPNIVQLYGDMLSLEYGGVLCYNLFLEYAAGGSLLNLIQYYGGKIPESDVRCYTRMILEGLCDIHEKGCVHCDLKPANILVFPSDQYGSLSTPKIADFGLAKEPGEERDNVPKTTVPRLSFRGTERYMSPESVKDGKITASLDIWSLGCIVVEMMTGKPPWDSIRNLKDLALEIAFTSDSPNIPEDISKAGKDFLMKCFAKNPCERWTADRLLGHPFLFPDWTLWAPQRSFLQDALAESYHRLVRQPTIF
ncbi:hypothetical protein REPUB_Repub10bG0061400 [Reevesia pubescens]